MRGLRKDWLAYLVIAVIQVATLAAGLSAVSVPAQMLLMPALALVVVGQFSGRLRLLVLLALLFSFLGDSLPNFVPEAAELPALIGSFAVAQVCWIRALWPARNRRSLVACALAVVPSILVVIWCFPGAGALWPAVVIYAALLFTMVVVASAAGWRGALGGGLFWFSDCLIAITSFVPGTAGLATSVLIMATYAAAQGFLVAAAMRVRPGVGSPVTVR